MTLRFSPLGCLWISWLISLFCAHAEPTRVDVMVVYTPAVTAHYSGENGVMAHLLATFAGSNAALAQSNAAVRYHLIHAAEVDYQETTFSTDLERLQKPSDGYLDEIHGWRDAHGADLVCFMRHGLDSGSSGVGYVLKNPAGSPDYGFCVVSDIAALSNFTFAHELGHNLGSNHARNDANTGDPLFKNYSYGYRFVGTDNRGYGTIMATNQTSYSRIPFFSNPDISYQGKAIGVAAHPTKGANNAVSLSEASTIVAGYRSEQSHPPEILQGPKNISVVSGQPFTLSALVNGAPPLALQWYRGDPGDQSQPVPSATSATLNVAAAITTERYWLRVSSSEGQANSPAATVVVVDPPPGPHRISVRQDLFVTGRVLNDHPAWQEFEAQENYLEHIDLYLFRQGSGPGTVHFSLTGPEGTVLAERSIPADQLALSYPGWLQFDTHVFVKPGASYRISLTGEGSPLTAWAYTPDLFGLFGSTDFLGNAYAFRVHSGSYALFTDWQQREPSGGEPFDFDEIRQNDGITEGLRYALGLSDAVNPEGLPTIRGEGVNGPGGTAVMSFQVRKSMADVTPMVTVSTDLTTWQPLPSSQIELIDSSNPVFDRFEARLPIPETGPAGFMRIEARLPNEE